jgi:hypothetical protein
MGRSNQLKKSLLTGGKHTLQIILEDRFKRLRCLPCGMLRSECLDPIESKRDLYINWLLAPEGAIVIKYRDTLWNRNVIPLPCVVVFSIKLIRACLLGPSFQEGSKP